MTTVSVHQPNFMPWIKLMAKVLASDIFVAYDSVQFTRKEFHARQLLKTQLGKTSWLSVPVVSTGSRQILKDTRISYDADWRSMHLSFLGTHYAGAPYFEEVFALIEKVYARRHELLVDHNIDLLEEFCRYLGSDVRIVRASSLPHCGEREERLLALVRNAGGDTHLTSTSTTHYIDWSLFERAGIPVLEQVFDHPVYEQPHGEFIPNLGVGDLLFARGRAAACILRSSSRFEVLEPSTTSA